MDWIKLFYAKLGLPVTAKIEDFLQKKENIAVRHSERQKSLPYQQKARYDIVMNAML
jgi:hypothetical protein